ncbi:hypothetical protein QOT17_007268 [Balamuthia mandrillaris]
MLVEGGVLLLGPSSLVVIPTANAEQQLTLQRSTFYLMTSSDSDTTSRVLVLPVPNSDHLKWSNSHRKSGVRPSIKVVSMDGRAMRKVFSKVESLFVQNATSEQQNNKRWRRKREHQRLQMACNYSSSSDMPLFKGKQFKTSASDEKTERTQAAISEREDEAVEEERDLVMYELEATKATLRELELNFCPRAADVSETYQQELRQLKKTNLQKKGRARRRLRRARRETVTAEWKERASSGAFQVFENLPQLLQHVAPSRPKKDNNADARDERRACFELSKRTRRLLRRHYRKGFGFIVCLVDTDAARRAAFARSTDLFAGLTIRQNPILLSPSTMVHKDAGHRQQQTKAEREAGKEAHGQRPSLEEGCKGEGGLELFAGLITRQPHCQNQPSSSHSQPLLSPKQSSLLLFKDDTAFADTMQANIEANPNNQHDNHPYVKDKEDSLFTSLALKQEVSPLVLPSSPLTADKKSTIYNIADSPETKVETGEQHTSDIEDSAINNGYDGQVALVDFEKVYAQIEEMDADVLLQDEMMKKFEEKIESARLRRQKEKEQRVSEMLRPYKERLPSMDRNLRQVEEELYELQEQLSTMGGGNQPRNSVPSTPRSDSQPTLTTTSKAQIDEKENDTGVSGYEKNDKEDQEGASGLLVLEGAAINGNGLTSGTKTTTCIREEAERNNGLANGALPEDIVHEASGNGLERSNEMREISNVELCKVTVSIAYTHPLWSDGGSASAKKLYVPTQHFVIETKNILDETNVMQPNLPNSNRVKKEKKKRTFVERTYFNYQIFSAKATAPLPRSRSISTDKQPPLRHHQQQKQAEEIDRKINSDHSVQQTKDAAWQHLKDLTALHQQGRISQDEFVLLKSKLIDLFTGTNLSDSLATSSPSSSSSSSSSPSLPIGENTVAMDKEDDSVDSNGRSKAPHEVGLDAAAIALPSLLHLQRSRLLGVHPNRFLLLPLLPSRE